MVEMENRIIRRSIQKVHFSQKELDSVIQVNDFIHNCDDSQLSRQNLTRQLMRLCGADYAASFAWDRNKNCFIDAAFENMNADNIERYNNYFQYHNPLTYKLRHFRRAVAVSEVMPHQLLRQTEFYNDFLQKDGLTFGANLFIHSGERQIFDFRLWRSRKRQDFQDKQLKILDCLIPSLQKMSIKSLKTNNNDLSLFTRRERQVIEQLRSGLSDKHIANNLNISVTTLRTHLRKIYDKADVHSRTELISKLCF